MLLKWWEDKMEVCTQAMIVNNLKMLISLSHFELKAEDTRRSLALSGGGEGWEDLNIGLLGDFSTLEEQIHDAFT